MSGVGDPCEQSVLALEQFIDAGYKPYTREEDFDAAVKEKLAALRSSCSPRAVTLAEIIADRALHAITTAEAVTKLDRPELLDENDWIALKALGLCARYLVGDGTDPYRHRTYRQRALDICVKTNQAVRQAVILNNWTFAELSHDELDEADRLWRAAEALVADPALSGDRAVLDMLRARHATNTAKLSFRKAEDDDAAADELIARGNEAFRTAIKLMRGQVHQRVNMQIEHAQALARLAMRREEITIEAVSEVLATAQRAVDDNNSDDTRAYFHGVAAEVHELAAARLHASDEPAALAEWGRARTERQTAIAIFTRTGHHLVKQQRAMLEELEKHMQRLTRPRKIFLSHRGIDKPRVRAIKAALESVGFEPWLDENELPAGALLERRLADGMEESCAAVFFLTPNFVDDGFLKTEIDYALAARRRRPWFRVIPLPFAGDSGPTPIPPVLEPLVQKTVTSDLDALREIVEALPVRPGTLVWKKDEP